MVDSDMLSELDAVITHLNKRHEEDKSRVSVIRATTDPNEYYTDYFLQWRVKK